MDALSVIYRGNRLRTARLKIVKGISVRLYTVTVTNSEGVGTDDKVTVNGRSNENALSSLVGTLEDDRIDTRALFLVKNEVLSALMITFCMVVLSL